MGKRLKYLEDSGGAIKIGEPKPLEENIRYPILGRYDFVGNGPRPGEKNDLHMYEQARLLQTRGEQLQPTVKRIAWILIRLAVGLLILYFVLRGETFNCGFGNIVFD